MNHPVVPARLVTPAPHGRQLETRLQELKDEKHEMFLKLKKVLNEDETRRRQQLIKDAQAAQQAQQALGPPPNMQPVLQLQPPISQHGTGRITLNSRPGHHPSLLPMVRDRAGALTAAHGER